MSNRRSLLAILWPSFLVACVIEAIVFALVDPANVYCGADALQTSRQGIYTGAFFVFWLMAAASSACTVMLGTDSQRHDHGARAGGDAPLA